MSSIKQKIGKCIDCPPGSPDVPLIAGRCYALHYWKHRKTLKPQKQMKRKAVKKISDKMLGKVDKYKVLRISFLKENPICFAKLQGCTKEATDIHHTMGRTGDLFLDYSTWIGVCRHCHTWIETHPNEAKELGLSASRLSKNE